MAIYQEAREKTRTNLVNAFWDIYCEKDLNKITIKEITDRAGYNRATFYIYFKNAQGVLDYVEEQLYAKMRRSSERPQTTADAETMLRQSINDLDQNRRFLCVLLSDHGDPKFSTRFREHFYREITHIVESGYLVSTVPLPMALDFTIGGIVNCLQKWYEERDGISAEALVHNMINLLLNGTFRLPAGTKPALAEQ